MILSNTTPSPPPSATKHHEQQQQQAEVINDSLKVPKIGSMEKMI